MSAVGVALAKDLVQSRNTSGSQTSPPTQASLLSPMTLSETASASEVRQTEKVWNTGKRIQNVRCKNPHSVVLISILVSLNELKS